MRNYLLALLFVLVGETAAEAGEQVSLTETENYTIRLKNNSDQLTLLKIGRASIGTSCDQVTDITISEVGVGKMTELSCGPIRGKRYCISTTEGDKGGGFSSWVQIDCTENFSSVLNLNLFGR